MVRIWRRRERRRFFPLHGWHNLGRPIKMESNDYQVLQGKWAKVNGMILEKASVWYTVINLLEKRKLNATAVITHHVA
jgi:hypothetical protein